MVQPYKHEPLTDFSRQENVKAFLEGLKKVQGYLGREYDLVIGGKRVKTNKKIVSINPADKKEVVGYVSQGDTKLADEAINAAYQTFQSWRKSKPETRADILFKAAQMVRKRKHEFSALLVKEAGKTWREADADTAEGLTLWNITAGKCWR